MSERSWSDGRSRAHHHPQLRTSVFAQISRGELDSQRCSLFRKRRRSDHTVLISEASQVRVKVVFFTVSPNLLGSFSSGGDEVEYQTARIGNQMNIFEFLGHQHRVIGKTLDALHGYAAKVEAGTDPNHHDLTRFVLFFREFAHQRHQEAEEQVLFPLLTQHGFSLSVGPLAHIRQQHDEERQLLTRLMKVAARRNLWTRDDADELCAVARELVHFERVHLEKENELLFPSAKEQLTEAELQEAARGLAKLEQKHGDANWLEELAEELIADYVPKTN